MRGYEALAAGFGLIGLLIGLAAMVFAVLIYWKIFSKAGYSGAMSLLMFVPIANIIVLCMLAFGEWPIYRELNMLRQRSMGMPPFPPGPQMPPQQYQPIPGYPQPPQYPQQPQYPQYPQQ